MSKIKILNLTLIMLCATATWFTDAVTADKILVTVVMIIFAGFWLTLRR